MQKKIVITVLAVLVAVAAFLITVDIERLVREPHQQGVSQTTTTSSKGGRVTTAASAPTHPLPPTKSLPSAIMNHLIGYAKRVQRGGPTFTVSGHSVLVIDPSEQYAIAQFQQVWARIQPVTVIWTNTKAYAEKEWKAEGYQGDPLLATQTSYRAVPLPTPIAYHKTGNGWMTVGGILRTNQVQDWIRFFGR